MEESADKQDSRWRHGGGRVRSLFPYNSCIDSHLPLRPPIPTSQLGAGANSVYSAFMYPVVDHSYRLNKRSCTMPDSHSFPAILQLPRCIWKVSGTNQLPSSLPKESRLTYIVVLATTHNFPLLRPSIPRSRIPRLLPHSILPIT
jgi:hypothetical protein